MDLPASLAWLVDEAGASPSPDLFLADLGGRLLSDGLPLAGGALTLAVPHHRAQHLALESGDRSSDRGARLRAMTPLLEAYLGRRSAARVRGGALRRSSGETIAPHCSVPICAASSPCPRRPNPRR